MNIGNITDLLLTQNNQTGIAVCSNMDLQNQTPTLLINQTQQTSVAALQNNISYPGAQSFLTNQNQQTLITVPLILNLNNSTQTGNGTSTVPSLTSPLNGSQNAVAPNSLVSVPGIIPYLTLPVNNVSSKVPLPLSQPVNDKDFTNPKTAFIYVNDEFFCLRCLQNFKNKKNFQQHVWLHFHSSMNSCHGCSGKQDDIDICPTVTTIMNMVLSKTGMPNKESSVTNIQQLNNLENLVSTNAEMFSFTKRRSFRTNQVQSNTNLLEAVFGKNREAIHGENYPESETTIVQKKNSDINISHKAVSNLNESNLIESSKILPKRNSKAYCEYRKEKGLSENDTVIDLSSDSSDSEREVPSSSLVMTCSKQIPADSNEIQINKRVGKIDRKKEKLIFQNVVLNQNKNVTADELKHIGAENKCNTVVSQLTGNTLTEKVTVEANERDADMVLPLHVNERNMETNSHSSNNSQKTHCCNEKKLHFALIDERYVCLYCKKICNEKNTFQFHIWWHFHSLTKECIRLDCSDKKRYCPVVARVMSQLISGNQNALKQRSQSDYLIKQATNDDSKSQPQCRKEESMKLSVRQYDQNRLQKIRNTELTEHDKSIVDDINIDIAQNSYSEESIVHQEGTFYVCGFTECSFSSMDLSNFRSHLENLHTAATLYPCAHCHLKSFSKKNLLEHMNIHINKKLFLLFKCTFAGCQFGTNLIHEFKNHILSLHKDESSYCCAYCHMIFLEPRTLLHHLHSNLLKIVQCPYCSVKDRNRKKVLCHIIDLHHGRAKRIIVSSQIICKQKTKDLFSPKVLPHTENSKNNEEQKDDDDATKNSVLVSCSVNSERPIKELKARNKQESTGSNFPLLRLAINKNISFKKCEENSQTEDESALENKANTTDPAMKVVNQKKEIVIDSTSGNCHQTNMTSAECMDFEILKDSVSVEKIAACEVVQLNSESEQKDNTNTSIADNAVKTSDKLESNKTNGCRGIKQTVYSCKRCNKMDKKETENEICQCLQVYSCAHCNLICTSESLVNEHYKIVHQNKETCIQGSEKKFAPLNFEEAESGLKSASRLYLLGSDIPIFFNIQETLVAGDKIKMLASSEDDCSKDATNSVLAETLFSDANKCQIVSECQNKYQGYNTTTDKEHCINDQKKKERIKLGGSLLDSVLHKLYLGGKKKKCMYCSHFTKALYSIHFHILKNHLKTPLWKCCYCTTHTYSELDIKKHCWKHHRDLPLISDTLPLSDLAESVEKLNRECLGIPEKSRSLKRCETARTNSSKLESGGVKSLAQNNDSASEKESEFISKLSDFEQSDNKAETPGGSKDKRNICSKITKKRKKLKEETLNETNCYSKRRLAVLDKVVLHSESMDDSIDNTKKSTAKRFKNLPFSVRLGKKISNRKLIRKKRVDNTPAVGFKKKRKLQKSVKLKSGLFKCSACSISSHYKSVISLHVDTFHNGKSESKYNSSHCSNKVDDFIETKHFKDTNQLQKESEMEMKSLDVPTVSIFDMQMKNMLKNSFSTKSGTFYCVSCSHSTQSSIDIACHIWRDHMHVEPQKCQYCDFMAWFQHSMLRHVVSEHAEQHRNNITDEQISVIEELITKNKSDFFVCPFCNRSDSCFVNSKIHIWREHLFLKYKKCPYCSFVSWFFTGLQKHIAQNHSENGSEFVQNDSLSSRHSTLMKSLVPNIDDRNQPSFENLNTCKQYDENEEIDLMFKTSTNPDEHTPV